MRSYSCFQVADLLGVLGDLFLSPAEGHCTEQGDERRGSRQNDMLPKAAL